MISESISDDIPPQMKTLNMLIPHPNAQLTFFFQIDSESLVCCAYTSSCQLHKTTCQPMKSNIMYQHQDCNSISQDILSQIFYVIQSDVVLQMKAHQNGHCTLTIINLVGRIHSKRKVDLFKFIIRFHKCAMSRRTKNVLLDKKIT